MVAIGRGDRAGQDAVARVVARFDARPRIALCGWAEKERSALAYALFGDTVPRLVVRDPGSGLAVELVSAGEDVPAGAPYLTLVDLLLRQHAVVHVVDAVRHRGDAPLAAALERGRARYLQVPADAPAADVAERLASVLPAPLLDAFVAMQLPAAGLRRRRVRVVTYARATVCAALGLAGAPESDILAVQASLVASVARLCGVDAPADRVAALVDMLGVGPGMSELARLLLSWVPGGPPVGAPQLFAGTVALGETAAAWARGHLRLDDDTLRAVYRTSFAHAREEWPTYTSRARRLLARLQQLRAGLVEGALSGEDYDDEFERLGERDDRRVQLASG